MSENTHEPMISVPVPQGAMPAVISAINDYYASGHQPAGATRPLIPAPATPESVRVEGNGVWTREEIRDLHSRFKNPVGRAVIRPIAAADGEPVTYAELAEAAGITIDEVRPQLAWFSKYAKAVKALRDGKAWPMTVSENPKLPKGQRYTYRMPPQIGKWWLEAEGDSGS